MKTQWFKRMPTFLAIACAAGTVVLATGCVVRRTIYVPAYQYPSTYPGPTVYATQPGATNAPAVTPNATTTPPGTMVVTQAPPPAQVEVIPVSPSPAYDWTPGYWYWSGPGWIWYSGRWVVRPWRGAVWVHGNWMGHSGRWAWHGGHWR